MKTTDFPSFFLNFSKRIQNRKYSKSFFLSEQFKDDIILGNAQLNLAVNTLTMNDLEVISSYDTDKLNAAFNRFFALENENVGKEYIIDEDEIKETLYKFGCKPCKILVKFIKGILITSVNNHVWVDYNEGNINDPRLYIWRDKHLVREPEI